MGKTNPTYRDQIREFESEMGRFRRMLQGSKRQDAFQDCIEHIHANAAAGGAANRRDPTTAFLMSICVEQQRRLNELAECVDTLEGEASGFEAESPPAGQQRLAERTRKDLEALEEREFGDD